MKNIRVKINLYALGLRLAAERAQLVPLREIHAWLNANGFELRREWHCDGSALEQLSPDEVFEIIAEGTA